MDIEIVSSKVLLTTIDPNTQPSRMTINYINPAKISDAALAADDGMYQAFANIVDISLNNLGSMQLSVTKELAS